mmetsp:Transcript_23298/g.37274  ORF Transcript_23298/g.37274 Transcript_23298/m.37274 type:complete len:479 (-) Transcript_23298:123-1559(-)
MVKFPTSPWSYGSFLFLIQLLSSPERVASLAASFESRHHQQHVADGAVAIEATGGTEMRGNQKSQRRQLMRHEETPPKLTATKVTSQVQQEFPYYHTSDELKEEVIRLSTSCDGALSVRTLQDNGTSIDVITVRKQDAKPVNRVFLLFGEHSRELISPESGLFFLQMLCGKAQSSKKVLLESSVTDVLQDNEFRIVLNGNPHSRKKVEQGNYCLRTNPDGVDLNRNWDEKWEREEATFGGDSNPGPKPFSEPETRIFKRLVTEFQPTTFLTVHSGTRGMYMPWAYDTKHLGSYNQQPMMEILTSLDKQHCECPFGAAGREVGYPCPGTCLDYAYGVLKTPYVFAFEIYSSPDTDEDLKTRWDDKMRNGGASLLQSGSHLGHAHFKDFFDDYVSDFVGIGSDLNAPSDSDYSSLSEADQALQSAKAAKLNLECFRIFNPETEEKFNQTVNNWAAAYIDMSVLVARKIKAGQVVSTTLAP